MKIDLPGVQESGASTRLFMELGRSVLDGSIGNERIEKMRTQQVLKT
jgi:hypothetical protein